jgi:hypothetical protein
MTATNVGFEGHDDGRFLLAPPTSLPLMELF